MQRIVGVLDTQPSGVLDDIADAKSCWPAAVIGFVGGAFVPALSFSLVHGIFGPPPTLGPIQLGIIVACLADSSISVWNWAQHVRGSRVKATTFVVLLEAGMLFSHVSWAEWVAFCFLVFINATTCAATVARRARLRPSTAFVTESLVTPSPADQSDPAPPSADQAPLTLPLGVSQVPLPLPGLSGQAPSAPSPARARAKRNLAPLVAEAREYMRSQNANTLSTNEIKRVFRVGWKMAARLQRELQAAT